MRFNIYALILICLITLSCSKKDNDNGDNPLTISTKVSMVAQDQNDVYQYDIVDVNSVITTNLSDELGVPRNPYFYSQNLNPYVSFYEHSGVGGGYRLWEKNLDSGSSFIIEGICTMDPTENPFSLSSTRDFFFVLTTDSDNVGFYINLRVYNRSTNTCEKIRITEISGSPLKSKNPIQVGNYLYLFHNNVIGSGVISKINLTNFSIENQLTLEGTGGVTIKDNVLHAFINGPDDDHYEYDLDTFDLLRTNKLAIPNSLGVGMFVSSFMGESMLMANELGQPGPIAVSPIFIDLNSGAITLNIDMYEVKANLEELYPNTAIFLESLNQVDVINEVLVGVFSILSGPGDPIYAVYYVDFDSNVLSHVEIDLQPFILLIR